MFFSDQGLCRGSQHLQVLPGSTAYFTWKEGIKRGSCPFRFLTEYCGRVPVCVGEGGVASSRSASGQDNLKGEIREG